MAHTGIKDKIVLITGASGSIGGAVAEEFARQGARLALTGRSQEKLDATRARCVAAGATADQVFTVTGDVTKPDEVQAVVEQTVANMGGLDMLINTAGIIKYGLFITTKMEDYDQIFKTNFRGVFLMCKHAVPHLVKSKGCIVNLSSYAGIRPAYAYFAYALAEAALDQFTRSLALEVGPKGVRVNSVNPGVVRGTDFWTGDGAPFAKKKATVEQIQEGLQKMYPLQRLAEKSDVTNAITFLCSNEASFIHGITLPVDGGKILTSKACVDDKPQH